MIEEWAKDDVERLRRRAKAHMCETYGDVKQYQSKFSTAVNEAMGTHFHESTINRFLNKRDQAPRRETIAAISGFLTQQSFWPHIQTIDNVHTQLSDYFDAQPIPKVMLETYLGRHLYYQHSTRQSGYVATSELKFTPSGNPNYLTVEEISKGRAFTERFSGIFFVNRSEVILMRENKYHGPKLLLITESYEPDDKPPWVVGRLLKTTRNPKTRHQCNWYFRRMRDEEEEHIARFKTAEEVEREDPTAYKKLFKTDLMPDDEYKKTPYYDSEKTE